MFAEMISINATFFYRWWYCSKQTQEVALLQCELACQLDEQNLQSKSSISTVTSVHLVCVLKQLTRKVLKISLNKFYVQKFLFLELQVVTRSCLCDLALTPKDDP